MADRRPRDLELLDKVDALPRTPFEGPVWQIITEHYKDEKPIPLTMCFGLPPAATLIAGGGFDYVVLPRGGDELGAAGAVQGFPIRIVKARTADAWAIA